MKTGIGTFFGILAVALLVFAGLAGQGTAISAQEGSDSVRVMTYNIKHGQGNDDCEDEEAPEGTPPATQCAVDLERTADVIASFEPDIVALQEVDRWWARSGGVDQPTELVEALDMAACFGMNLNHEPDGHADEPHQYGTVILSKFPILSCDNTLLPTPEGWEQRGLLEVRAEVEGVGEVAILNTHLQAGREGEEEEAVRQRTEQADTIAERIAEIDVPVILMGDLNAEPDDEELAALQDPELRLQDAWEVAGEEESEGYTSPASPDEDAEHRIDYIFASSDFEVLSAEVPVTEDILITSDHLPVVADLAPGGLPAATPIISTDVTPEPTLADEAPAAEPTLIIAPTMEPVEEATPPPTEQEEPAVEPTAKATEAPEAQPTEEPEPTTEPAVEPTAETTEAPEPTAEQAEEEAEAAAEQAEEEAEAAAEQAEEEAEQAQEEADD
jgi:endonuclease/exonuclease/phosphatase family metal-dependent hydrolase